MREAIARAELGDDVFGEDPTVNRLEAMAARAMGKEAALLVASGTMGNLVALLVHCPRATTALVGSEAHTYFHEAGAVSAVGSVVMKPVRNSEEGELDLAELEREIEAPADVHLSEPAAVALENTHNRRGGAAVALAHMVEVGRLARRRRLSVHLDGARIFNAALALGTSAAEIASHADTVSFCLSKGLAAPVGSLVCGSREFVARARRLRKVLGGGMRQAGIIAAAGIVALETMVERLAEDHHNARLLAQGLGRVDGLSVRAVARPTNMVFFEVAGGTARARRYGEALSRRGVLVLESAPGTLRAVTHHGITKSDIDRAIAAAHEAARELQPAHARAG